MTRLDLIHMEVSCLVLDRLSSVIREGHFFDKIIEDRLTMQNLEDPDLTDKRIIYFSEAYNRVEENLSDRKKVVREFGFNLNFVFPQKTKIENFSPILKQIESVLKPSAQIEDIEVHKTQLVFWGSDRLFDREHLDIMIFRSLFEMVASYPRER